MKKSENNHEIEKNENNNNDKVLNTEINENNLLNIESNTPSKDKNVYGDQNINQNMIIIDEDIEKKFNLPSETLYENEILPAATKNEQNSDGIIKINVVNLRGEDLPFDLLISLKIVELPELPELLVRAINENKTPEWYFRGKINLNLEQRSKNLNLLITLKGKKNDEFIDLASNRLDLTEVLDNDEKWAFNNYIELQPSLDSQILPPMIYLQLRWLLSRKIYPDYDSEPTDVNELEKTILKPIFQENHAQFKGFLHLNIVKAKNLKPKDEFLEPFCEFWFSHKRNEKEYTILITPTLKPVWNERRVFDLGKVKVSELNLSKLIICVWNKDQIGEDYLGGIVFNLKDIIEEENEKWLNGWFQLKDDHSMKTNCGEIYLQLGYFKDKKDKNETQPPILD